MPSAVAPCRAPRGGARLRSVIPALAAVLAAAAGGVDVERASAAVPPPAPTGVVASRGPSPLDAIVAQQLDRLSEMVRVVHVAWDATDGVAHEVVAEPGGAGCALPPASDGCSVWGLVNGTSYTFKVRALSAAGAGEWSAWSNAVVPADPPEAPQILLVSPGPGTLAVEWAPQADNGAAIASYTATAGDATCTVPAAATSCTLAGLVGGTAYDVHVVATNEVGTSTAASASGTPTVLPGAPTGLSAAAGVRAATLVWEPAATNGYPLVRYDVASSPAGGSCTTTGTLQCVVEGLAGGTAYTFTVRATTSAGTGPASAPSAPVTPRAAPDAPAIVAVSPGPGTLAVSWSVPADNGAPITVYEATTGGSTCAVVPPATRCTLVGLDGGTTYAVRVVAINEVGTSPPSASASGTPTVPSERPSAPSAAVARRGDGRVTVSWRAAEPRGAAITGYAAVASPGGASCTAVPPALRCAIAGLRNGTAYTVAIVATNANGSGEPARTGVVVPAGPPSTPPGVAVALRGRIATVAWRAAASNGAPVLRYVVTVRPGHRTCTRTGLRCVVRGLRPRTRYAFTVAAANDVGTGPASAPLRRRTGA